jgi:hypothetical protein
MVKPLPVIVVIPVDEGVDDAAGGGVDVDVEPLLPPPPQAMSSGTRSMQHSWIVVLREMCGKRICMGTSSSKLYLFTYHQCNRLRTRVHHENTLFLAAVGKDKKTDRTGELLYLHEW